MRTQFSEDTMAKGPAANLSKDDIAEASASEIKNRWHSYLEHVRLTGSPIVITRYGRPVAKLAPIDATPSDTGLFGCLRGTLTEHGDVIAPVGEGWSADA